MKSDNLDIGRLIESIETSRLSLSRFRTNMAESVKEYVGAHYSEEGAKHTVPVNLIGTYISIVGRNLIAKNPRVMLSTFDKQSKPSVYAMQQWANDRIEQMYFAETMKRVVVDALFSVGIAKVSLMTPAETSLYQDYGKAGSPRVVQIDLDDFVYDIHARNFQEAGFSGHRVRVPLDILKEDKSYGKERKDIQPSNDRTYNEQGDERIKMIGRQYYSTNKQEFQDYVDLWEIYIPSRKAVFTFYANDVSGNPLGVGATKPLKEQAWIGPDCGPYHMLGYGIVPGNAMPKAPIQDLLDLHLAINNCYRKLIRQAERLKEILLVGGTPQEGTNIVEANDGEAIRTDNPDRAKIVAFGGPNQMLQAFTMGLKDLFSWIAGNLDIMGGLSPQSRTATQDTMLNQNSARSIADMQDTTITYTASVLKSLAWYWWHDPQMEYKSHFVVPGLPEYSRPLRVTPQQRQRLDWRELQMSVDPHSMQHSTPQSRWSALSGLVQSIIIPLMPALQAQGIKFDINAFLEKGASYLDMPDLGDIVQIAAPLQIDQSQGGTGGELPSMDGGGKKTYERISRPGMSDKANSQVMQQALAGGKPQQSQTNNVPGLSALMGANGNGK